MGYNYQNFDAKSYELGAFRGPLPGTKAPDFEVQTPEGDPVRLLEFDGAFLVLEMGSLTCPLFQGRRTGMDALARTHPDLSFAVLYVREAHPGAAIPAHASGAEKRACAHRLVEDSDDARRILVDDLEGTAHVAYGAYPNAVFIIDAKGCVAYVSDWNNAEAVGRALKRLKAGKPAPAPAFFKPVSPAVLLRVFREGGPGALADFLRSLPRLVWANLIVRNVRLMFGKPVGYRPGQGC